MNFIKKYGTVAILLIASFAAADINRTPHIDVAPPVTGNEANLDSVAYEPRRNHTNDNRWYGDKSWRTKNIYGRVNILPYPENYDEIWTVPDPEEAEFN